MATTLPMLLAVGGSCGVDRDTDSSFDTAGTPNTMPPTDRTGSNPDALACDAHAAWHAERLESLRTSDGWLTLVGLDFLDDGVIAAGRDENATLSYGGCAADRIGRFELQGEVVRFVPETGAPVSIERGVPGEPLVADDAGSPSVVRSGTISFTLVRRNGRLALRVRDSESPVRRNFAGIGLYPFDPSRAVEAVVRPAPAGETIAITNVTGHVESQPVGATLEFELDGEVHELKAMPAGEGRLFVVFGDATNGVETYGGGRFLEVPMPADGRTIVDFNRAYNPPCAFTAFATCPMPPPGNRLPMPIEAGERRYEAR